ncbi:molecular chaperone TorD [Wohlfahrtiimonas larvae]|uniref:Chaperone protein TorD n=1 Tax=Wohlfahrtiimonas larvae TaxID=1157986 RepID=A0ABP9N092_9GAMM|nr:molecular chaperone TorD [Wohlfahrtiimonas larvae]
MMKQEEWLAVNEQRAAIYQWFSAWFALEQTQAQLDCYHSEELNGLYELFDQIGLTSECTRFKKAIAALLKDQDARLELSADFAQHFLLDDKVSALPYASFYLEDGKLYGDVETKMRAFLSENKLEVSAEFKEPADHLAVYLELMVHWIQKDKNFAEYLRINTEQVLFLTNGLLSWLPEFVAASQKQKLRYDVYSALSALLLAFIRVDILLLKEDT